MSNENNSRNVVINDVELHWVKLSKPVDNYAGDAMQYEIQARVPKKRDAEFAEFGKTKVEDGMSIKNFYKKELKADGTPGIRVKVVDVYGDPINPGTIGNGSKGNIRLLARDFEIKHPKTGKVTKSGVTTILMAVQVTELIKYEPQEQDGADFDYAEKKEVKAGAKRANDVEDDDIPF